MLPRYLFTAFSEARTDIRRSMDISQGLNTNGLKTMILKWHELGGIKEQFESEVEQMSLRDMKDIAMVLAASIGKKKPKGGKKGWGAPII